MGQTRGIVASLIGVPTTIVEPTLILKTVYGSIVILNSQSADIQYGTDGHLAEGHGCVNVIHIAVAINVDIDRSSLGNDTPSTVGVLFGLIAFGELHLEISRVMFESTARDLDDLLTAAVLDIKVAVGLTTGGNRMFIIATLDIQGCWNFHIAIGAIEHSIALFGDKVTAFEGRVTSTGDPDDTGAVCVLNLCLVVQGTSLILAGVDDFQSALIIDCDSCINRSTAAHVIEGNGLAVQIHRDVLSIDNNTVVGKHTLVCGDGHIFEDFDGGGVVRLDDIQSFIEVIAVDSILTFHRQLYTGIH